MEDKRKQQRGKDTELPGSTKQGHLGIFQQGSKIGHGTHGNEDEQRK